MASHSQLSFSMASSNCGLPITTPSHPRELLNRVVKPSTSELAARVQLLAPWPTGSVWATLTFHEIRAKYHWCCTTNLKMTRIYTVRKACEWCPARSGLSVLGVIITVHQHCKRKGHSGSKGPPTPSQHSAGTNFLPPPVNLLPQWPRRLTSPSSSKVLPYHCLC